LKIAGAPGPLGPVTLFDNYWAPTLVFARSLGERTVPLHIYGNGATRWSRYRSRHRSCPPLERADEFLPWLRERVRSGDITRIAPTTDLLAYYVSYLREEFPPEVQRAIAPLAEIETALIKPRFCAACTEVGQAVPQTYAPEDLSSAIVAARQLGYPLILKPKSHVVVGSAERGRRIRDERELREHFRPYTVAAGQTGLGELYPELRWPLLQKYVPSAQQRVYSVTGFKDADSGIITACLSYKREQWPLDVGTSVVQVGYEDDAILQTGLRTVDKLLSCGIFELELLADGATLTAIDLNPRGYGFIGLDVARGRDYPWLWYQSTYAAVAPETQPPPLSLEARHVTLYLLRRAFRWQLRGFRALGERRDPQRPRAWISMLGSWSDPLPGILGHAMLLRNPRSLITTQFSTAREELARHLDAPPAAD
jgi:predicted ATP-grasp superfamily ATP-dependent carboligase